MKDLNYLYEFFKKNVDKYLDVMFICEDIEDDYDSESNKEFINTLKKEALFNLKPDYELYDTHTEKQLCIGIINDAIEDKYQKLLKQKEFQNKTLHEKLNQIYEMINK